MLASLMAARMYYGGHFLTKKNILAYEEKT
jgi:hypothetical protein